MFLFFLSSGLFLGWSLGANHAAANVFGTAVGSRMISFKRAAILCSVFVILGAVISGAGTSDTIEKLGSVNAIAGAFIVALAAALSVYVMTVVGYPVSTSEGIIGAIIGWHFFTGTLVDYTSLTKIVSSWIACPILSAIFSIILYKLVVFCIKTFNIRMFKLDKLTRYGLIIAGIFGAYSLGANNIANVMGVFVPVSPFRDISFMGIVSLTSSQQLFLIGGISIALGVITYSRRVMVTVGTGIMRISPVSALVAVWAHSTVLFLFASQGLERFLINHGLPSIPLVPVSSSQAIVGAVIGIGLLKGGKGIRWKTVGGISVGWVATPLLAALISFISLFFFQNVFQQQTYKPVEYVVSAQALERIEHQGIPVNELRSMVGKKFPTALKFNKVLKKYSFLRQDNISFIMESAEYHKMEITETAIHSLDEEWLTEEQIEALEKLEGQVFIHTWMMDKALARISPAWNMKKDDKLFNRALEDKLAYIHDLFRDGEASVK
ncbi:MAG TPA: inorganic phosphate transporter [Syntrophales bacterium]|nr:inorganic phosphate transporter [Syntrophales bacterium]HPQ44304.1 inorganic phosphate transporter [Syntrophales bacterium]